MSKLLEGAAAKTLSTDFNKVGLRKITALFETTKHNITRLINAEVPGDVWDMTVEFGSAGGAPSMGAHPTGGSSAGGVAGKWIEKFNFVVNPLDKLIIQIGRGGIPTPAGTYTFTAANHAANTFIQLNTGYGVPILTLDAGPSGGNAPTATRGGGSGGQATGSTQQLAGQQPADAAAGLQGVSMSSVPAKTTQYLMLVYPPMRVDRPLPYGWFGTCPGTGAGIIGGNGTRGGYMGLYDDQSGDPHASGANNGVISSGGAAAFGLHPERYRHIQALDTYVNPFKFSNGGVNINVDTPNQELYGAGGVGAATGHMGSYGGDGVLCISFYTALPDSEIDPIWLNPIHVIDTTTNPAGLAIPRGWFGIHGISSAAEILNGEKINGVVGATSSGTVSIVGGVPTFTCANGHGLYNARANIPVILIGLGAGGTDFETRLVSSAFFGTTTSGTSVTATLSSTPPTLGVAQMKFKAYVPPYNWGTFRSHDSGSCSDWARADLGLATGTLASGNNVITAITLVNRFDFTHQISSQAITIGMAIVGAGIPANTTITGLSGSAQGAFTITMSNNATASGAVSANIYNKVEMDDMMNSPMLVGKKVMFMMSGCPEWLAKSIVNPISRTVSGTSVTITHDALDYGLQVGMPLTVRNSAKAALNGRDPIGNVNWKVTASTTTTTTFTTPTATGNESGVADTAIELIPWNNEQTYGYACEPNPAVGAGFGEVNKFVTWLMTDYGSMISHLEGQNEANTGYAHHGLLKRLYNNAQGSFYIGTPNALGEVIRRTNQAAKAIAPTVKIGTPSVTGIAYGQEFFSGDGDFNYVRSSAHRILSAGDGLGGKMVDWCDYVSVHMYSTSANWRLNTNPIEQINTWLKFITRLMRMESINKPNLPLIQTEGGHEAGASRIKFFAMSEAEQANEIFKWYVLQLGFGVQGAYPFLTGFLGDAAGSASNEAAYIKVGTHLAGKTLAPKCCYNKRTGAMLFATTDGYEEYIP